MRTPTPGRSRHRIVGLWLALLVGSLMSGCLGGVQDDASRSPAIIPLEEPEPTAVPDGLPETASDILRIQGDPMLDRLAQRMRWSGSGSVADPYVIQDLVLDGRSLVFQDLTRSVHLRRAQLDGPEGAPALLLWNVTGISITGSTITGQDAPAVAVLESTWVRIESNVLRSDADTVDAQAVGTMDVLDNDLYAGGTALRFSDDAGDHWVEGNRIHRGATGIHLQASATPSSLLENRVVADTGIRLDETTGTFVQDNVLQGTTGVAITHTPDVVLIDNVLLTDEAGITAEGAHRLVADGNTFRVGGITILRSELVLLSNFTYTGPGPAALIDGGRTIVLEAFHVTLPVTAGEGIRIRGTQQPLILGGTIEMGTDTIILERTHEATILDTRLTGSDGTAIFLNETTDTLVAGTRIEGINRAIHIEGGRAPQIVENVFNAGIGDYVGAHAVERLDVAYNIFEGGAAHTVHVRGTTDALIEGNEMNFTALGIRIQDGAGTTLLHNRIIDARTHALTVDGHRAGGLQILDNHILSGRSTGIRLATVDDLLVQRNTLISNALALDLRDVTGGLVFDNYFDNQVNVLAAGTLDVQWNHEPKFGTNIRGGDVIAGNWWSDYTPVDADEDGIGDVQHGLLPYTPEIGGLPIPNYGVIDKYPIVADGPAPDLPAALPRPDPETPRLARFLGQHPMLDAILERYV